MILTLVAVLLIFVFTLCIAFLFLNFLGDFLGAPFVPTSGQALDQILKKAKLKKGSVFIELGSGDGRLVMRAVQLCGVKGIGVEFNPLLVWYSRLMAKLLAISNLQFYQQNLFSTDLRSADTISFFLYPKTIRKLTKKIIKECRPKTLIISHGFRVKEFEQYLTLIIERKVFSTYSYSLGVKQTSGRRSQ